MAKRPCSERKRAVLKRISSAGGTAAAKVHQAAARKKWERLTAHLDKADVWPVAYRAGYRAASSAAERRGYRKGWAEALGEPKDRTWSERRRRA